jgi:carboxypeptidase Taq
MEQQFQELKGRLAEISDVFGAMRLLAWDQQTMMPPRGAQARAEQLSTLNRIAHEKFVSPEIGRLLDELRPYEESLPYESDEASLIRIARRDFEKISRVPAELEAEMTRTASLALPVWAEARERSDFQLFLPWLKKNVDLRHQYVELFPEFDHPYDALLENFDYGTKSADAKRVLDRVKEGIVPLVTEVAGYSEPSQDGALSGPFPIDKQQAFGRSIIERWGFNAESWRLDPTVHPFASSTSTGDVRLTTRYREDDLESLFAIMHECGHGLYEHGIDPALERTPVGEISLMALHESQSRTWENLVGRSRPFWRHFYPQLQETFKEPLGSVDFETFYRSVNRVQPSLIRIEADEVTYNLHVIMRFELELDLIAGKLEPADVPDVWNARMLEYLGVEVPDDAHGVLQDMHWSGGAIGYFPTYSLGNVVSVQLWEKVREAIPDLDEQIERGEFQALHDWYAEKLYRHGRKFTTEETLRRLTGGPMDPEPYLRYLRRKVADVYGLAAEGEPVAH